AWFDPHVVRRSARHHGLNTDAGYRFERGTDPEAAPAAAERIATLAARPAGAVLVAEGKLPARPVITLRPAAVERILGKSLSAEECGRILTALGCERQGEGWRAPSWRHDLTREIDLTEELARLHGYQHFPARLPRFQGAARPLPEAALRDQVRRQ